MSARLKALRLVGSTLAASRIEFVSIGSEVVLLHSGIDYKPTAMDVDLFVLNVSPFLEEDLFKEIAEKHGWRVTQTWIGSPSIVIAVDETDINVDLYENILDFYVPREIVDDAARINLKGFRVKVIPLEGYIVLKAKAGRDIDERDLKAIRILEAKGKIRLDLNRVKKYIKTFPEEDRKYIEHRLSKQGFLV